MKVYVAGSSSELNRATRWSQALRDAGITVVSTWPEVISRVGSANPTDAPAHQRRSWAYTDLVVELGSADWLWLLAPLETPGRGAYVELGCAFAARKNIVCSGPTVQSIFCALGTEYAFDQEAFDSLVTAAKAWPR